MSETHVAAGPALAAAAALGPFFAWEELPSSRPRADAWRPLHDLADAEAVAERVDVARAALIDRLGLSPGDVTERVVASIVFLGLASRLVSPPLAALALADALPTPRPDQLWWRPVDSGPLPVAWSAVDAVAADDADTAVATFNDAVLGGLVEPVLAVFHDRYRLSPKILYGNVASALGGAVTILRGARPDRVARAGRLLEALLARAPLAGSASVHGPGWTLKRHNCCLYYRIPGGGYCGDCVLRR